MNSLNTALALDHAACTAVGHATVTALPQTGRKTQVLASPQELRQQLPLSSALALRVQQQREQIRAILSVRINIKNSKQCS